MTRPFLFKNITGHDTESLQAFVRFLGCNFPFSFTFNSSMYNLFFKNHQNTSEFDTLTFGHLGKKVSYL